MHNRPAFDLVRVAAAVKEGRVKLGKTRASDILLTYLGELVACNEFACAVLLALKLDNFHVTKGLDDGPYDEYGIHLPDALLEQFGLDGRAAEFWYVKLTVREGLWGEEIFCLSLHPLEHEMNCVGGRLDPTPRDEP